MTLKASCSSDKPDKQGDNVLMVVYVNDTLHSSLLSLSLSLENIGERLLKFFQ